LLLTPNTSQTPGTASAFCKTPSFPQRSVGKEQGKKGIGCKALGVQAKTARMPLGASGRDGMLQGVCAEAYGGGSRSAGSGQGSGTAPAAGEMRLHSTERNRGAKPTQNQPRVFLRPTAFWRRSDSSLAQVKINLAHQIFNTPKPLPQAAPRSCTPRADRVPSQHAGLCTPLPAPPAPSGAERERTAVPMTYLRTDQEISQLSLETSKSC